MRARMSSLQHGMRAEVLILPTEDAAAIAARREEYYEYYDPQSPAAYYYVDMMITAERLANRCEDAHDAGLACNCDGVRDAFEQSRSAMVAAQAALLETQPAEGMAALKRSEQGCAYAAQALSDAAAMLTAAGSWPLEMAAQVVHLFGAFSDPDRIGENEMGYRLFVSNLKCRPHDPAAAQALALLSAPERRPAVLRGVDLSRWVPAPEVCGQWLIELLNAEVASLRLLEEALRTGKDGASRHRVMTMAKMMPEGDLSRQYLRYRKEADARFVKGHRALLAELARDAKRAEDEDDDDCGDGAGSGVAEEVPATADLATAATVATGTSAAAEAIKTDRVDSPIDPGNGRTATTAPRTGGNGLFVLVLLAVLLGQFLGGLGRVKAWAASLAAEQPRAMSAPVVGWVEPRFIEGRPTDMAGAFGGPHAALRRSTHPTIPDLERRNR
jgi:hypothetical protein